MSQSQSKSATVLVEKEEKEKEEKEVKKAVIIDLGSDSIKIGLSGDDYPRSILLNNGSSTNIERDIINNFQNKKDNLALNYPIEHGIVTSWDDMEKIWRHTFYNELRIESDDQKVLLTGSNSCIDYYKMTEILFERFNIGAIFIGEEANLSLYASGKTTGVVLDCGYGKTTVVPIVEGEIVPNGVLGLELGGYNITNYLMSMFTKRGYDLFSGSSGEGYRIAREMKEVFGYVSKNFETEINNNIAKSYKLPDGKVLTIDNERFQCAELLFQPKLINKQGDGIHKLTYDSIMKCDINIRKDLCKSIILSGGTTMFQGLKDRLKYEMQLLTPSSIKQVNIYASPERDVGAFIGASIVSSLECFEREWITREEYDDRLCYVQLRGNCSSVRYTNSNGGNNGGNNGSDDIILKNNISSTRCIH